jgi:hypothetical protein
MAMTATFVVVLVVSTLCWRLRERCRRVSLIALKREDRKTLIALKREDRKTLIALERARRKS